MRMLYCPHCGGTDIEYRASTELSWKVEGVDEGIVTMSRLYKPTDYDDKGVFYCMNPACMINPWELPDNLAVEY